MQLRFRRLLEDTNVEESTDIDQECLISLLAKNKALLIKSDHGKDPLTVRYRLEIRASMVCRHRHRVPHDDLLCM